MQILQPLLSSSSIERVGQLTLDVQLEGRRAGAGLGGPPGDQLLSSPGRLVASWPRGPTADPVLSVLSRSVASWPGGPPAGPMRL